MDRLGDDDRAAPSSQVHIVGGVPLYEGDVIAQKYRVDRLIGSGGLGVVLAARHLQLDEPVAIKVLHPEAAQDPEAVARFKREARAALRIRNEHVVRIMDVGELESGEPFMVMEYLAGVDLGTKIAQAGPLAIKEAVRYVLQAAEAIAGAHALGIIHRDIKPANLFVSRAPDGTDFVKVLDFGLSKTVPLGLGSGDSLTRSSQVMGSPLYMSPEQMSSARDVDARTDIWSIGVVLYEALTAQPPFTARTLPQLCATILSSKPRPMRILRVEIPEDLEQVVLRCLEHDRAQRWQDMAQLAAALLPFGPKSVLSSVERITKMLRTASLSTTGADLAPMSLKLGPVHNPGTPAPSPPPPPTSEAPSERAPAPQPDTGGTQAARYNSGRRRGLTATGLALGLLAIGVGVWWAVARAGPAAPGRTDPGATPTSAVPASAPASGEQPLPDVHARPSNSAAEEATPSRLGAPQPQAQNGGAPAASSEATRASPPPATSGRALRPPSPAPTQAASAQHGLELFNESK